MRDVLTIILLGLTSGSVYGLLGIGFGLIFFVTGRFHFAFSVFATLSAYLVSWGSTVAGLSVPVAVVLALAAGVAGGVLCEVLIYRLLDRKAGGSGLLGVFIASLGLVIAGTAIIQLVWDSQPSYFYQLVPLRTWQFGGTHISLLQLTVILAGLVIALVIDTMIVRTSLGRQLRAVEASAELAQTYGLNVRRLTLVVFVIGSFCLASVGILRSAQYAASSTTGSDLVLYALLVAFLTGGRRPMAYVLVGILVGIFEAAFGRLFGGVWQQLAVFFVLFVYIAVTPYRYPILALIRRLAPRRNEMGEA